MRLESSGVLCTALEHPGVILKASFVPRKFMILDIFDDQLIILMLQIALCDWFGIVFCAKDSWLECNGLYESSRAVNNGWRFTARTKSTSRWLVKNVGKWFTKMKISQNLWIQLSPEQFSRLDQVKSCPGIYSLCLSMRFTKSCTETLVFTWLQKIDIFMNFRLFAKVSMDRIGSS